MPVVKPVVNKIQADISNVSIYLRTTKKFGKTTLFRDVIMEKYGDSSRGLLIACGNEHGYTMLDHLNVAPIDNYRDLVDTVNWLIQKKGIEHNIEMIAFDTADELSLIADKETIARSTEETGKRCRSIKGAFGGFNAGVDYSANNLIKPLIGALKKAGFGIWILAHTRFKTIREKGGLDEEGYMQLTSNLTSSMESAFGDCLDIVLTGVIDRDTESKVKKVGTGTKKENYVTEEVRKLYFRGTTMIDAGGRFADGAVPEYMIFDKRNMAKDFIKIVEDGIEASKTDHTGGGSPVVKPVKVEVPIDGDQYVTAEQQAVDDLAAIKKQIVAKCTELGGTKNTDMMNLLKMFVPSGNPNAIWDTEKAKQCLAALNDMREAL